MELLLMGVILMGGIYYLGLYILRRQEVANLWFALICLNSSLRSGLILQFWGYLFPHSDFFTLNVKLEYLTMLGIAVFNLYFFKDLFQNQFDRRFIQGLSFLYSIGFLMILALDPYWVTFSLKFFQSLGLITILTVFLTIAKIMKSEDADLRELSFKMICIGTIFSLLLVLEIASYMLNHFVNLTPYAQIAFILGQAFILAQRNTKEWDKREHLSKFMKLEIKNQTELYSIEKEKAENLSKFSLAISQKNDVESLLNSFYHYFDRHFHWNTCLCSFYEEDKTFRLRYPYTPPDITSQDIKKIQDSFFQIDSQHKSLVMKSVSHNRPLYLNNSKTIQKVQDPTEQMMVKILDIKKIFIYPLYSQNTLFGFITLIQSKRETAIDTNLIEEMKPFLSLMNGILYGAYLRQKTEKALKDLKEAQTALSRSERSASINSMVSHLAHEINNPLNFISTGEAITRDSYLLTRKFVLNAIPDSEESRPFKDRIIDLFDEMEIGINQSSKGSTRIKETIEEIRSITGVDGLRFENFNPVPLIFTNLELTLEKNQISNDKIKIQIGEQYWPAREEFQSQILSNKYIFSRSIRTVLNNSIVFALRAKNDPEIRIEYHDINLHGTRFFTVTVKNNGPAVDEGKEVNLFDLKSNKYFGTEIIGLPLVKELLKSIQCNLTLIDNGRKSGWVEFQILIKDFE
jgi:signal transduction histidine kinase